MRFRRIVIGVDFTEASLAAARWAALQFAPDAEIALVHVLPPSSGPAYLRPYVATPIESPATLAPTFHGALRALAGLIGGDRTRVHMTAGQPADELAAIADTVGAELVCVGRRARRRGGARFGATTAERLLARSRVPVLIVPPGRHGAPACIGVAIDGGAGSAPLLDVACRLAAGLEARVEAVHAIDEDIEDLARAAEQTATASVGAHGPHHRTPPTPIGHDDGAPGESRWVERLAHDWVTTLLDGASVARGRAIPAIRVGDAGHQIVAHAAQRGVDLVVLGRGGRGAPAAVREHFVGSTARFVAWAAPCPVLVVPHADAVGALGTADGPGARGLEDAA